MHVEIHSSLQNHSLTTKLVEFNVKVDVRFRPFDESAAHGFEPLHELPRNAADHEIVVFREDADRGHIAGGGHSSKESVTLDEGCLRPLTRRGHRCNETGRTSTCDNNVIFTGQRS